MRRRTYPLRWRLPLTYCHCYENPMLVELVQQDPEMDWTLLCEIPENAKAPSCDSVDYYLSDQYDLKCMKPYQKYCWLPSTNLQFPVIKHWFFASVFSLLIDDSLTRPENLICKNAANPTEYHEFNDVYGEVDGGTAYWQFVDSLPDPMRTVVVPIIIFGNGTVVDGAMWKPLGPFMFNLGILWQHIQSILQMAHFGIHQEQSVQSVYTWTDQGR